MTRRLACILLGFVLLAPAGGALDLFISHPRDGQVVFGTIELEMEVLSAEPVAELEVRLDGEVVTRLVEPPYRVQVDVGEENRSHTLVVTVTDVLGESVSRKIVTGMLEVDLELDLELQQLYVTATRRGKRILDFDRWDFTILDDDTVQELVTFERGDVPLTAALLIDSSSSMAGDALRFALAGARAFVESMQPLDEAKVIVFSDRLLATTPFTGDPALVSSVMASVEASGGTAINDHLYLALKEIESRQGRQVVVLLSDGLDIESVLDMTDVAWKAGRMQSLIYWIRPARSAGLDSSYCSVWRDPDAHRREIADLERVVRSSGGRIREIGYIDDAAAAFREILQELREQYVLGYYPSDNRNDGAWHTVVVRSGGVQVRARGGYFDDQP